jgi:phosphoglucomutase
MSEIQESWQRAKSWAENSYFSEDSRKEIQSLIDKNDEKEIVERFYKDLEFGTGGMRSILGQGTNRMNRYNIRKATQAVSNEILRHNSPDPKVAISFDTRNFSFEFAKEAAGVFAANGIKAFIYKNPNPVALCSFAIREYGCAAGVMVTASHNPPEYNGFKVFWSDGAQVTPPNDKNIIDHFNKITDYSNVKFIEFDQAMNDGLVNWVSSEVENKYYELIKEKSVNPEFCREHGANLNIVYTPIHGTGLGPCTRAIKDLGFTNVNTVKEQESPDGNFPTVTSPNPENPEALELAVKLMKETNADLAIGSDPDADRVGVAFIENGDVCYLNGNQIGLLMLHYMLQQYSEKGIMPKNPLFIKTIVTSRLQDHVAAQFGVRVENTLTGFKWICGRLNELEKTEKDLNFIFATEESFGYLNHGYVRDKDGVSSISLLCEIALWHKQQGMNFNQALDKIYEEFGYSGEELLCLNYYGKEGAEKISRIMDYFRNYSGTELDGRKILKIEDYQTQTIKDFENDKTETINLPKSNVLGFHMENGKTVYLRPSGTEPKIKFYIMGQETEGTLENKKAAASTFIEEFINYVNKTVETI